MNTTSIGTYTNPLPSPQLQGSEAEVTGRLLHATLLPAARPGPAGEVGQREPGQRPDQL